MALTYGSIGKKRLVIETENLGEIVEIWMLNSKRPEGVIHPVIEVYIDFLNHFKIKTF